jgi:hypothetical protein
MEEHLFAFTIDLEPDIPHLVGTYESLDELDQLLALLQRHAVSATFLVTGQVARVHPSSIKRIVAAKHEVGCHGMYHEPFNDSNPAGLEFPRLTLRDKKELLVMATEAVEAASGMPLQSFRAPYLSFDTRVAEMLLDLDYQVDSSQWSKLREPAFKRLFPWMESQPLLEVPVPTGLVDTEQPHSMAETGLSGFSLRLAGQEAVRTALMTRLEPKDHSVGRVILFSCHPWEYVSAPSWQHTVPEYFWWHSERLFDETEALIEFAKGALAPRFVTLQQVSELLTLPR